MSGAYRDEPKPRPDPWDQWLGPHERTPLERTRKALETNYEDASAVQALVEAQGREIARLQTIVLCLVRALEKTGAVDLDALGAEATAKLAAAQLELPKPKPPGLQHPESVVTCVRCSQRAVAKTTFMTAAGTMCEQCYAAEPR